MRFRLFAPCLHVILLALTPVSAIAADFCAVTPLLQPPPAAAQSALTADAANLEAGIASASGDVRLERDGQALTAPALTYNRSSGRATADQGLLYAREGLSLQAESADINLADGTGRFGASRFTITGNGGRGGAAEIQSLGDGNYRLGDADYTTCPSDDPAWRLHAGRIALDRESGRGEAYNAVFRLFDLPVFYTPYLNFPIDDQRHSGFLAPTLGRSGDSGFELALPWYVNLAPGRDATITPRLLTDRGFQIAGQFRYLERHHFGEAVAEYLPSDREFGADRSLLRLNHVGRFSPHLGLEIDYNKASDDEYLEDLGTTLARTSRSQLRRLLRVTAAFPGARFAVFAQNFQSLTDDAGFDFTREPFEQLPAAQLSLLTPGAGARAGLDAEFIRFQDSSRASDRVEGLRYDLRPRLRWSRHRRAWHIDAEAAYRYTRYDLDEFQGDATRERGIASLAIDTGLHFQRVLAGGWLQTLEPRARYQYNEFEDQDELPLFDTGIPDLHYERLFADNRFVGSDRIGDANQIALGLTSRFIAPDSGRTVVRLDLGRIYGFRDLRVRLPGRSPIGFGERHSDVVANAEYRPARNWQAGLTAQYDPDDQRLNRGSVRVGFDDGDRRRLVAGYRFFRDIRPRADAPGLETVAQTELLAAWPIGERWHAIGRWNYSLEASQNVETLAGLEYRASCCWALRGGWRRYVDSDQGNFDNAVLLQIEFTGLGGFGDDIESLLNRDIVASDGQDYDLRFR